MVDNVQTDGFWRPVTDRIFAGIYQNYVRSLMSSKKESSSSGGLIRPLAVFGAIAGLLVWQFPQLKYLNFWVRNNKLNIEDFSAADFKVNLDIPTTYYEPGKIADVLKEV